MTTHDPPDDPATDPPDEASTPPRAVADERGPLLARDRLTAIVLGLALLALGLRFLDLGARVAHWQEARLGWWIAEYARTGAYTANPALGGSLLRVLGRFSTGVLGTSDLAIRAPVALAGGLLPVGALAFRRRLDAAEVVALAGLLGLSPLLVYYTRFASVDALAAVLALATVAVVLALRERPRPELVLAGVVLGVLAVAAEPRAGLAHLLALLVAWGAALLFVPPSAFTANSTDDRQAAPVRRRSPIPGALAAVWEETRRIAVGTGVVLLLVLLDPSLPGGLVGALTSPGALPGVLLGPVLALLDHLALVLDEFFAPPGTVGAGVALVGTLVWAAPVVTGLAVVGGLADHWADRPMRPAVTLGLTWAALGVPLLILVSGTGAPWVATHLVVALAIPAAVGAAAAWRWTRTALAARDALTGGAGVLACIFAVALVGAALVSGVYLSPTDPAAGPVQYGQPSQDLRGPLDALAAADTDAGTPDVVLYGNHFVEPSRFGLEPRCARWYNALPVPWYATTADATVECTTREATLRRLVDGEPTLVVGRERALEGLAPSFENYTATTLRFRAWNANTTVLVPEGD